MTGPSVSVILPTFNRADLLGLSIRSVLNQDFKDLELIVVDDGSTDHTAGILKSIRDDRLRHLRLEDNRGQSVARNAGIEKSQGEFIAFQDSDDVWYRNKLSRQIDVLKTCPEVSVVYSDMRRIRSDGSWFVLQAPDIAPGQAFDNRPRRYSTFGIGIQSCVFRRPAIAGPAPFNTHMRCLEDLELLLRLTVAGHRLHRVPQPLVDYYETLGVSAGALHERLAQLRLFAKYGWRCLLPTQNRLPAER